MPIYEYECPVCGRFEITQTVSEDPLKECPRCAEKGDVQPVTRLISAPAFHLKGSGWYKTDYASSSPTQSHSPTPENSKTDSKKVEKKKSKETTS